MVVNFSSIQAFIDLAQKQFDAYWKRGGYTFKQDEFKMIDRQKFVLITLGSSAHCFVAKTDFVNKGLGSVRAGDIFKAASYNAPAKNARGNIFNSDKGLSALDGSGRIRYLG